MYSLCINICFLFKDIKVMMQVTLAMKRDTMPIVLIEFSDLQPTFVNGNVCSGNCYSVSDFDG